MNKHTRCQFTTVHYGMLERLGSTLHAAIPSAEVLIAAAAPTAPEEKEVGATIGDGVGWVNGCCCCDCCGCGEAVDDGDAFGVEGCVRSVEELAAGIATRLVAMTAESGGVRNGVGGTAVVVVTVMAAAVVVGAGLLAVVSRGRAGREIAAGAGEARGETGKEAGRLSPRTDSAPLLGSSCNVGRGGKALRAGAAK